MKWRVLEPEVYTGLENMQVDQALFEGVENGTSCPTIRLYYWEPSCISLGHSQKADHEINLDAAKLAGVDVVKRMTGGRAVYHVDELTYSVVAPHSLYPWCETQRDSYEKISAGLAYALKMSLRNNLNSGMTEEEVGIVLDKGYVVEKKKQGHAMSPCFSSTARSEVVYQHKKLIGSAQRRKKRSFLQHGSILCSRTHRKIVDYLNLSEDQRETYLAILDQKAISLEDIQGTAVEPSVLAQNFGKHLAEGMGVPYEIGELSTQEKQMIKAYSTQSL